MRLILVRHGETELNRTGRILGKSDAPLNAAGRAQASANAAALAADLPFALYTSPLVRAVETARIVGDALGVEATPLDDLQEADAGELDGMRASEARRLYPEFYRRWEADASTARMPGGESLSQVQERAWEAVTRLADEHGDGKVVAVTHDFVIRAVLCMALDMPLRSFGRLRADVGSIARLEIGPSYAQVLSINETSQL